MRSGPFIAALGVCAPLLAASPARAQGEPAPEVTPQAPRLQCTRGPAECLDETDLRNEVAIAGDGVDRFDPQGAAVVRAKSGAGGVLAWQALTTKPLPAAAAPETLAMSEPPVPAPRKAIPTGFFRFSGMSLEKRVARLSLTEP